MIGEGDNQSVKPTLARLTHHLLDDEPMTLMHAIESANRSHTGGRICVVADLLHDENGRKGTIFYS